MPVLERRCFVCFVRRTPEGHPGDLSADSLPKDDHSIHAIPFLGMFWGVCPKRLLCFWRDGDQLTNALRAAPVAAD